jgi:hypothetical protein
MATEWTVVFDTQVSGNEQAKLVLRVTKLEGEPVLIMDIREVTRGRFTKAGVSLNLQESKWFLDVLTGYSFLGYHPYGGRQFSYRRTPNGMDLLMIKKGGVRQKLFLTKSDLVLIRPLVEKALEYMASELGDEPMEWTESQVKELPVEPVERMKFH